MKKLAWLIPVAFIFLVALALHLWDRFEERRKPTAVDFRHALIRMREEHRRAERAKLLAETKSSAVEVRRTAIRGLASHCGDSQDAGAAVVAAFQDEAAEVRGAAAYVVFDEGAFNAQVVPELLALVQREKNADVRQWAIRAVGKCGEEASLAVEQLLAIAKHDQNKENRYYAAKALGDIGPVARVAEPTLRAMMGEKGRDWLDPHWAGAVGLARVGCAEEAVDVLIDDLRAAGNEFADWLTRKYAADAIGEIGPPAKKAVPALRALLRKGNTLAQDEVLVALASIGPDSSSAVPELTEVLKEEGFGAFRAARALGRIGPSAREAVPALKAVAKGHPMSLARAGARTALHCILKPGQPQPRILVPVDGQGPLMELHEGGIVTKIETRPATRPTPSSDTEPEGDIAG